MNKFSTFLLGTITGAIALGITACVCESSFTSSSDGDATSSDCEADKEDKLSPDYALIVR